MPALIFLVIATAGGNLFGFLSQLAYNSGILSKFVDNIKINYHPIGQRKEHSNLIKEHLKKQGITQTWLAKELCEFYSPIRQVMY